MARRIGSASAAKVVLSASAGAGGIMTLRGSCGSCGSSKELPYLTDSPNSGRRRPVSSPWLAYPRRRSSRAHDRIASRRPGRASLSVRAVALHPASSRRVDRAGPRLPRRDAAAAHDPAFLDRSGAARAHRMGDPHRRQRAQRRPSAAVDVRGGVRRRDQTADARGGGEGGARVLQRPRAAGVDRRAGAARHRRAQAAPHRRAVGGGALPPRARRESRRHQAHASTTRRSRAASPPGSSSPRST